MKNLVCLIACLGISFYFSSCKNNSQQKSIVNKQINIDSLKLKTYLDYKSVPKNLNELIAYSDYDEILSNLNFIDSLTRDFFTKEMIKVSRFKVYYLSRKTGLALNELQDISTDPELKNYKAIHLGIYYLLQKDTVNSKRYFQEVYGNMENENITEINCIQYALVSAFLNKTIKNNLCHNKNFNNEIVSITKISSKNKIIEKYFLNEIRL